MTQIESSRQFYPAFKDLRLWIEIDNFCHFQY